MQGVLDVFVVQQQPQLKTGYRCHGLEAHQAFAVVFKPAVERLCHGQGVEIAAVLVAVKDGIHLLKSTRLDALVFVAKLKKLFGVLHHLHRVGAQSAGVYLDAGGVQPVGLPDFAQVVGLGLAAFANDQDAVVAGASP